MSELLKQITLSSVSSVQTYEFLLGIKKYIVQYINFQIVGKEPQSGYNVTDLDDNRLLEGQELSDMITIFESLASEEGRTIH